MNKIQLPITEVVTAVVVEGKEFLTVFNGETGVGNGHY